MPFGTGGAEPATGASVAGGGLFMLVGTTASLVFGGAHGLGCAFSACFKFAAF